MLWELERINLRDMRGFEAILGKSMTIKNAVWKAERIADADVTVSLTGESGTGMVGFSRNVQRKGHRICSGALVNNHQQGPLNPDL